MKKAILHTGSNLGDRAGFLQSASNELKKHLTILKSSLIYESAPWGNTQQDAFLNQALLVETSLSPFDLLVICQQIELQLGRTRKIKWGPRNIDIDIIFFDDSILNYTGLVLPHPQMHLRNFVLRPILEITPDWIHPKLLKDIKTLTTECPDQLSVVPYTTKPNFIAIEGNIGAGKTTLSKALSSSWDTELILEEFSDNPFLPYFYENPERYAFSVELFFMTERHKQLQTHFANQSLFQQQTVADYFFLKTLLFARNNLQNEEFRLFKRLFDVLNASFPKPDLIVYLHRPLESILHNIAKRGRSYEQSISPKYLQSIQTTYLEYFKQEKQRPVLILDIGKLDFIEDTQLFEHIKSLLTRPHQGVTTLSL